jgi:hypothetical protein
MNAAASETAAGDPAAGPLVESAKDTHETEMTYDASSRVPWWVVAVWICSMAGFVAYLVIYLFPDLARWGAP